ncbi:MADS-box protein SOC1-like [Punica granatum]|uniref:MADS-box protein SOC1-like n=1 Tax=Punica granatum TaxID=22663 RepID=A0A6P8CZN4_PUNGR|nr:MADS-box protein SOC1-like [Punica granatum]XP_031389545.1 MADS-box protein SOC1-like [Punica granatum]XP_031389546.1 MADS-box protein SOC1-like [Punica granatum]
MVRGKTQMRRIENATSRQVTFSKRRNGLLKKAFELSVLCDAEVALVIFSPRGKLYEFASSSVQDTIERYMKHTKDKRKEEKRSTEHEIQLYKQETADLMTKIELLEASKRKLLGGGLGDCSIEELQQIEQQLEMSVSNIRARKTQVFKEQIEELKEKEMVLTAENAMLCDKCGVQPQQEAAKELFGWNSSSSLRESSSGVTSEDVETQLFIGPPPGR